MAPNRQRTERLVVVALAGLLALNYPLLALFSRSVSVFGIPLLYLYLFLVWGLLIGLMAVVLERSGMSEGPGSSRQSSSGD